MSEGLSLLLGLFLPPIVEYVKTKFANNKIVNYSITLILCVIVGVISTIIEGKFNTKDVGTIFGSIGSALFAAQATYNYFWKPKKLDTSFKAYVIKNNL